MTLGTFLETWLKVKKHRVKAKTWLDYERMVRLHLLSLQVSGLHLKGLSPLHLEGVMLSLISKGSSPALLKAALRVLKVALGQAVDWQLLTWNPASRIKAPLKGQREMQVWTAEQTSAFLNFCQQHAPARYALFHLAITSGMRRGELLGLHWQDIDFARGELWVTCSLVQEGSRAVLSDPKTLSSKRRIVLAEDTLQVLQDHRRMQKEAPSKKEPQQAGEEGLVFPSKRGTFQVPNNLLKIFKKLMVAAGVPMIRFHDLRHTAASLLVRHGVPIKVVAERLGHKDASLTLRVYTHVYEEQRREGALPLKTLLAEKPRG
ncbi:tyrosine-type recombinase/integrase [Deinococcus roseus]|uniref:Site-specific integrase n=1 Tax=Deinococcus roseus TaxID=392414 RepID=A0ABQ2DIW8_9DEIO|nr:site-specific integrase [Deinococcus roseus]GGJ59171.1 site-specific integrase [Deinococcus roseus]